MGKGLLPTLPGDGFPDSPYDQVFHPTDPEWAHRGRDDACQPTRATELNFHRVDEELPSGVRPDFSFVVESPFLEDLGDARARADD